MRHGDEIALWPGTAPGSESVYTPVDAADAQSARPDYVVLLYPVINMHDEIAHAGSKQALLGPKPSAAQSSAYSAEDHVTLEPLTKPPVGRRQIRIAILRCRRSSVLQYASAPAPCLARVSLAASVRFCSGLFANPPALVVLASDDASVPPDNGIRYYRALRAAGVRAELHVYMEGGHGFGIGRAKGHACAGWPDLTYDWMAAIRVVPPRKSAHRR